MKHEGEIVPRRRAPPPGRVKPTPNGSSSASGKSFQGIFQLVGVKAEGAPTTRVGDATVPADEEEPVGVGRIGPLGPVVHRVDKKRNPQLHPLSTTARHRIPFAKGPRLRDVDTTTTRTIPGASGGTPAPTTLRFVVGMGLPDVNDEEVSPFSVPFIQLLQAPGLPSKGSSGVGAKGKNNRFFRHEIGETNGLLRALNGKDEVGSLLPNTGRTVRFGRPTSSLAMGRMNGYDKTGDEPGQTEKACHGKFSLKKIPTPIGMKAPEGRWNGLLSFQTERVSPEGTPANGRPESQQP